MTRTALIKTMIALAMLLASVWCLETARGGLVFSHFMVGTTPVTAVHAPESDGPVVVVAHGFAGSSPMMLGYALPLARAGYRVFLFDFLGHGRNDQPMSGDVTSVDGTTRLLVEQTSAVVAHVGTDGAPVALLGHSMASDILVRVAAQRSDVGPVVLISAFSNAIDDQTPSDLLLITGAWEAGLRGFAQDALRMVDPTTQEGDVANSGEVRRSAIVAPRTEHVSVLHSPIGRRATADWLDSAYERRSDVTPFPTGPAIVGLLVGLVMLGSQLARGLPRSDVPGARLTRIHTAALLIAPMLAAPLLSWWLDPQFLPVLVADYLGLHLALYGGMQLALLRIFGAPLGRFSPLGFVFLLVACGVICLALDRYVANFMPTAQRLWIVAVMTVGASAFFVADARLSHKASLARRLLVHGAFLLSLGFAVALDFTGLFFLLMIAPVIVLFYAVFGSLGHRVSDRCGPLAPGLALGLILALSLGVSFPLFSA